jgi:competence protein ComEC
MPEALWPIALAMSVTAGAWLAWAVPPWPPLVVGIGAVVVRRPVIACLALAAAASGLSAAAWSGLAPPAPRVVGGTYRLVSDPEPFGRGVQAAVVIDGHHVEAQAFGSARTRLAPRLAGERVELHGRLSALPDRRRARLSSRHIAAVLAVDVVGDWQPGGPPSRVANQVRRTIAAGAEVLPPTSRALFLGFVLGDDRAEPPEVVDEFRATGLGHLTAVSGENVAFLLTVAGPALRRVRLGPRWAVTLGLLAWFALLTRFEPSVLRAVAMAALGATSGLLGRPQPPIRLLAVAVTVVLLVDPLLVGSAGWWLSVAATAGITTLTRPIERRLPGPRPLALAIAVTVGAQIGVAPVELAVFGTIPLAAIPANVLAGPAAGPVMVYGLPAGLLAGLAPASVAALIHLPTRLFVGWIAFVAHSLAATPLARGDVAMPIYALVAAAAVAVVAGRRRHHRLTARARLPAASARGSGLPPGGGPVASP